MASAIAAAGHLALQKSLDVKEVSRSSGEAALVTPPTQMMLPDLSAKFAGALHAPS